MKKNVLILPSMEYVLWLASWYPNRADQFNGDFIERHAQAVSKFMKVVVVVVTKDDKLPNGATEIEKIEEKNLVVYRAYYGASGLKGAREQIYSLVKYYNLQKKVYKLLTREYGTPSLAHIHVAMKAGLLALRLKQHGIPYIVTEHWSGYNPATSQNIYNNNWLFRLLNKKILKRAAIFLPVSDQLGKIVNRYFLDIAYKVIPNVVDTNMFYHVPREKPERFRFIHASFMIPIKNPEGILMACKLVKERGFDFDVTMVGGYSEALKKQSVDYRLDNNVFFTGPVSYHQVAEMMQQSNALLMFSRYENLPCVIMEALCCGLPVISSDVGGVPEMLDASNGILVENENVNALAEAMVHMIDHHNNYSQLAIAQRATEKYNYHQVGKKIFEVYQDLSKSP